MRRVRGELRGQHTRSKGGGELPCLLNQRQPLLLADAPSICPSTWRQQHLAWPYPADSHTTSHVKRARKTATTYGSTCDSHADLGLEDQQPIPKNGTGSAGEQLRDRSLYASVNLGLNPTPGRSQSTSTGSPTCNPRAATSRQHRHVPAAACAWVSAPVTPRAQSNRLLSATPPSPPATGTRRAVSGALLRHLHAMHALALAQQGTDAMVRERQPLKPRQSRWSGRTCRQAGSRPLFRHHVQYLPCRRPAARVRSR